MSNDKPAYQAKTGVVTSRGPAEAMISVGPKHHGAHVSVELPYTISIFT